MADFHGLIMACYFQFVKRECVALPFSEEIPARASSGNFSAKDWSLLLTHWVGTAAGR